MALVEDVLKGNLVIGLAVGVGAIALGPMIIQTVGNILRPAAKSVIKGGMVFYNQTLAEMGELATDLVAEARAELDQEARSDPQLAGPRAERGKRAQSAPQ